MESTFLTKVQRVLVAIFDLDYLRACRLEAEKALYEGKRERSHSAIWRECVVLCGYLVVCLLVSGSASLAPYGFTDAYTGLAEGLQGTIRVWNYQTVVLGRPLYALLTHGVFSELRGIGDLRYLGFSAALGTGLLAWLFYRVLRLAGMRRAYALLIPMLICTTPPYEIWVGFATNFFSPTAAAIAGASLIVADSALSKGLSKQGVARGVLSGVMLLGSMMTFQPAAMVFLVFAAVLLLCRKTEFRSTYRRFGVYCGMIIAAIGVDAIAAKVLPGLLYGRAAPAVPRTQLAASVSEKIVWFFKEPLLDALNLWNLLPSKRIGVLVAIFMLIGLWLFLRGSLLERSSKFLTALALLPLSYLPSLLVAESWAAYRTQAALTSLVALYSGLAVLGFLQAFGWQKGTFRVQKGVVATGLLALIVVGGSLLAMRNVTRDIVVPQAQELSVMASQLNSSALAEATSLYIIPCAWTDSLAPVVRYDEFGLPSCSTSWAPGSMAYLLLRELDPAKARIPIIVVPKGQAIRFPAGSLVIDMRMLKLYQEHN